MRHRLQTIKACDSQNEQRALEEWGWVRARGQARFVVRSTLFFGLAMMIGHEFSDGGMLELSDILTAHFSGLMMGLFVWWGMEIRYKNASRQGRINGNPTGEIPEKHHLSLGSN